MMKNYKVTLLAVAVLLFTSTALAQQGFVHKESEQYVWPQNNNVLTKLNEWQDLKFGVLFHWGLYSVPGIVESWSICSEDEDWIPRDSTVAYVDYKKEYWELINKFNPTQFDPDQWANVTKNAGMKYMIFTTKHHDGFNLFDTKETDFSIMHGAFKDNPRANVTEHILDAFRKHNFMVGTYFSKPDWHSEYYWWPRYATPTRSVNYKIDRHPEQWKKFQQFTYNQIEELMTGYGDIDILWLDGGWVAAPRQDVKMDEIAKMSRLHQPGLLIVDRTIHGKHENYLTPERSIPDKQLPFPWESCITLSNDWGWVPNALYKSSQTVINSLIEITAKGGCMLLGVGPTPEGIIEQEVVDRLEKVGQWLRVNGAGIYGTRITNDYHSGNVWFTANKDKKNIYAIYALPENEELPNVIEWEGNPPAKGTKVTLLQNNKTVKWTTEGGKTKIVLPNKIKNEALVFSYAI